MTGLELQTRLANRDGPPIIFLTGHSDIPTTVKAMKGGATEKSYTRFHCDHHLMIAYGNYQILLGIHRSPNLNRPAEARVYGAKCVALARAEVRDDPNDATAKRDRLSSQSTPNGNIKQSGPSTPR